MFYNSKDFIWLAFIGGIVSAMGGDDFAGWGALHSLS
jgi:hypothetical protein